MKKLGISNIIALFLLFAMTFLTVGCGHISTDEETVQGGSSSIQETLPLPEEGNGGDLENDSSNSSDVEGGVEPEQKPSPPSLDNTFNPEDDNVENPKEDDETKPEQLPQQKPEVNFTDGKAVLIRTLTNLNVRSGPSTSSSVLGVTDVGDCFPYLGKVGDFYLTTYKNKSAYISNNTRFSGLIYFERSSENMENVIEIGQTLLGFPYVYGAQRLHYGGAKPILNGNFSFGEFDCSSLVQYMYYYGAGKSLQVTTRLQYGDSVGERINYKQIKRGDLLYFTNASRKNKVGIERIGHVAVYLGVGYDKKGSAICDYILHTATDHAVIEPFSDLRKSYFEGGIRIV